MTSPLSSRWSKSAGLSPQHPLLRPQPHRPQQLPTATGTSEPFAFRLGMDISCEETEVEGKKVQINEQNSKFRYSTYF